MPEFARLQQRAKEFSRRLSYCCVNNYNCLSFFTALIIPSCVIDDGLTIGFLAKSLDSEYDSILQLYFKSLIKVGDTPPEFGVFKERVLTGIYLMKWYKYNNAVTNRLYNSLIELFKDDLKVSSFEDIKKDDILLSLDALRDYCRFIYEHQYENDSYAELNRQLGIAIQVDIFNIRNSVLQPDSSWYGFYNDVKQSLGL